MANPKLWCEARCYHFCAGAGPDGRNACHETAPGEFGALEAARTARKAGWTVLWGEWCCPACRASIMRAPTPPQDTD